MKKSVLVGITAIIIAVLIGALILINRKSESSNSEYENSINAIEYAAKNWWEEKDLILYNLDEEKVAVSINTLIESNKLNDNQVSALTGGINSGCVIITYNNETSKYEYKYTNSSDCDIYNYNMPVTMSNSCISDNSKILYGDVNLDGKVNAIDRTFLTRYLEGWDEYQLYCNATINADLNLDGVINLEDLTILSKHISNYDGYNSLPIRTQSITCDYSKLNATYGDINKDGKIDANDRTMLSRYLTGTDGVELDCQAMINSDLNLDGVINLEDLTILSKHISNYDGYNSLPIKSQGITCDYSKLNATYGDINKDGKIDATDRTILARYLVGTQGAELDCQAMLNADLNKDGKVTEADLTILANQLSNSSGSSSSSPSDSSTCDYSKLSATYGDVNKDGKVDAADRTILSRYLAGTQGVELDCQAMLNADLNKDGKVTEADLNLLAKKLAG